MNGRALGFAWRSLVRQPARAVLAVVGVAAIGALLFDMLLLSQGLVTSMGELLDRTGWDVRVTATDDNPGRGPRIAGAIDALPRIAALPSVRSVLATRAVNASVIRDGTALPVTLQGVTGVAGPDGRTRPTRPPWTVLRGRDVSADDEVVVSEQLVNAGVAVGSRLKLQASCLSGRESLPTVDVRVVGVAEDPFEVAAESTAAGTLEGLVNACGGAGRGEADLILVASQGDPDATAGAIAELFPELRTRTNAELLGRLQQNGFSYFRQISTVLTTVTVAFALLLITVLLTVSVNQRLGEIAALRALGFSRRRVVADVLWESALIVGIGGGLSLPLGLLLARGLDRILTAMPGLPAGLHFFVFEPQALVTHIALLVVTAVAAALYPMRIVARLPIAATLRAEVIG
jgi:putative ABC transport system permease protein